MASILRQIVARPRARHHEANLDLCYVTDHIIATSGPSATYPQKAYRNPLPSLLKFLNLKHGAHWCIWEFRAEGTGYPDSAVDNRIWHFPWPDHHPPPFQLIPNLVASMRDWRNKDREKNVIVVHCKAGKGRSGTASISYLIAEEGWELDDALKRFTERRMRDGWGHGISIPSQLRWLRYVDRWNRGGKHYVERKVEVLEVRIWGLRDGVKLAIEGFIDEGKKIKTFHTFRDDEREVVRGAIKSSGLADVVMEFVNGNPNDSANSSKTGSRTTSTTDLATNKTAKPAESKKAPDERGRKDGMTESIDVSASEDRHIEENPPFPEKDSTANRLSRVVSKSKVDTDANKTDQASTSTTDKLASNEQDSSLTDSKTITGSRNHTGQPPQSISTPGADAIFTPKNGPITLETSDICLDIERRTSPPYNWTPAVPTSIAHVWFNVFFEGGGPERALADANGTQLANVPTKMKRGLDDGQSGVFEIPWDELDGLKGSSKKGTRAFERVAVVWRVVLPSVAETGFEQNGERVIEVPREGDVIPQMRAADWRGEESVVEGEDPHGHDDGGDESGEEGVKSSIPT